MHVDADKIDKDESPDVRELNSLVYMRGEYWTIGERIGSQGYTHKQGTLHKRLLKEYALPAILYAQFHRKRTS